MHQCPDSGFVHGQPDLGENAQEVIAEYTGEKAPAGVAPMGGCGGGARAPGGMALGPLRPQSLRQAPPAPGHAVWYAPGGLPAGDGTWATWIGQHPIPPSGARQRGRLPPPEPSAFPQMAPVDVRIIQKGDQIAQVAREVYGVSNPAVFAWIKQNNPHLQNVNRLKVGMQSPFHRYPKGSVDVLPRAKPCGILPQAVAATEVVLQRPWAWEDAPSR